jgi:dehypoxanthine futalosine cyclase
MPAPDPHLAAALDKAECGQRLSQDEGLALLTNADLLKLGNLAHKSRFSKNLDKIVTYVVDRNINTTNICLSGCAFCAFFKVPGNPEGYLLSRGELGQKIEETKALGGTQILMQGGLHPGIGVQETCDLFRFIKREHPIHIHALSPPEVVHMAALSGMGTGEALDRFIEAGLDSIPGGGAEILVDSVRRRIAPGKCSADEWIEVMDQAHERGLNTSATMMFGSVENLSQRIEHLARLRDLQEKSLARGKGRFTAFIPWTFQPSHTALEGRVTPATAVEYLRMLAVSRLFLDNIQHVQASWVTQGAKIAQVALTFGADDLGSTMIEENVVAAAGAHFRMSRDEMITMSQELGFEARQRDTFYHLL